MNELYFADTLEILHSYLMIGTILLQSYSRYFESHYRKFAKHKGRIENTFSFEEIKLGPTGKVYHLRMVKRDVDLTQFRWLREKLEKLYWVLRVTDDLRC